MTTMQWALYGSMLFEGIALVHRIALFSTMTLQSYGVLVSILSILHFAHHLADCGATNSLPPLLPYFSKNKDQFKTMIFAKTVMPHLPIMLIVSIIAQAYVHHVLPEQYAIIPPLLWTALIVTESVAAFLRQFLYTIQDVKAIVLIDLSTFCVRIASLWAFFFAGCINLSPAVILYSHLISILLYTALTLWRVLTFYHSLANTPAPCAIPSTQFLLTTKTSNYALRLSRNIFTANFLTPLFAHHFGLSSAGIFYFASKLAHFFVSVVKITIGYTGNGMLAASKAKSLNDCKKIFGLLRYTLVKMSAPLFVIFVFTSPLVAIYWYGQAVSERVFVLSVLFVMLSLSECFFILYECFYIIQHAASQLFAVKIVEIAVLYLLVHHMGCTSPAGVLCGIIVIRLSTLSLIVGIAYRRWFFS